MKRPSIAGASSQNKPEYRYIIRVKFVRLLARLLGIIVLTAGIILIINPNLFPSFLGSATSAALFFIGECLVDITFAQRPLYYKATISPPRTRPPKNMTYKELVDLFKHWDMRVAQQEYIFVPATLAPLAAALIGWKDLTKPAAIGAALVSLLVYISYLVILRRLTHFQDRLFPMIEYLKPGFHKNILSAPETWIGVRPLRVLGLPFIAAIWCVLLHEFYFTSQSSISQSDWWGIMMPAIITVIFLRPLWYITPNI